MSEIRAFCFNLPKVELHAHLNTSYSKKTLLDLMKSKNINEDIESLYISSNHPISESFRLFSKIQSLVTTQEDVYFLTKRVIEEYAEENVKYLELRSTPKHIPHTGMTKELYLRTMIQAVRDTEGLQIIVRILVSIDRRQGLENAKQAVDLAERLMMEENIVIGIDFSGDPEMGDASCYIPIFLEASRRKLKLALHLSEINTDNSLQETEEILKQCCDLPLRIGHGTFLQDEKWSHLKDLVFNKKIPIETCITSNLRTKTVDAVDLHHFKYWRNKGHPVILCADGKGVYNTSLTQEYMLAMSAFHLTKQDLKDYVIKTIDFIFENEEVKEKLRLQFTEMNTKNNLQISYLDL